MRVGAWWQARRLRGLKRRLRRHYEAYLLEVNLYDCGATLAEMVNPRVARHRREFNAALAEIKLIDPMADHIKEL